MDILDGEQKKQSLDLELAPYLSPFSLLSWLQKHKDQLWAHRGSAYPRVAIYSPERAQNTKDMTDIFELICFDHNFLPNAVINLIFDMWSTLFLIFQ